MTRFRTMTPWALVGAMLAVGCAAEPEPPASDAEAAGGTGVAAASADQMPIFEYDQTWPQMPLPDDWVLGNVVGVDVDPQDHI